MRWTRRNDDAQYDHLLSQARLARAQGRRHAYRQYVREAATLRLHMIREDLYR